MADEIEHAVHAAHGGLGKKLGPLPVWGWGALVGGVAVGFMYFHNSTNAAANATPVDGEIPVFPDTPSSGFDSGTGADTSGLQDQLTTLQAGYGDLQEQITESNDTLAAAQQANADALQSYKDTVTARNDHQGDRLDNIREDLNAVIHPTPHGGSSAPVTATTGTHTPHVSGGSSASLSQIERLQKQGLDKSEIVAKLTHTKDNGGGASKLSASQLKEIGFSKSFIASAKKKKAGKK